jgi:hypothetical protein
MGCYGVIGGVPMCPANFTSAWGLKFAVLVPVVTSEFGLQTLSGG